MSAPEPPKHRIEFTGSAAKKPRKPRRPRKPPPRWIVGWFGYVLLIVGGGALGGFAAVALLWTLFTVTDDIGSFLGALFVLLWGAILGAVAGGISGLVLWSILCIRASESQDSD